MTGDGVNDAPALKQAEVAAANATDVAKASASLVLTNPGLTDVWTFKPVFMVIVANFGVRSEKNT